MPDRTPSPRIAALLMASMVGAVTVRASMAGRTAMPVAALDVITGLADRTRLPRIAVATTATPDRIMASMVGAVTERDIMADSTGMLLAIMGLATDIADRTRLLRITVATTATPARTMGSTAGAVTERAIMADRSVMPAAAMDVITGLAVRTRSPRIAVAITATRGRIMACMVGAVTVRVIMAVRLVTPAAVMVLTLAPVRLPCTAGKAGAAAWPFMAVRRCRIIPVPLRTKAPALLAKATVPSEPGDRFRVGQAEQCS